MLCNDWQESSDKYSSTRVALREKRTGRDINPSRACAKFIDVVGGLRWTMQFATECRGRALVLMEMAKEVPEFKDRLLFVAELWLELAALEDQINASADQFHKSNLF